MLTNGTLHDGENGHCDSYPAPYIPDDEDPVTNNNINEISKWARDAVEFMSTGELEKALYYLNLCLDEKFRNKVIPEKIGDGFGESREKFKLSDSDELILLEKRCLVQIRLKMYDKAWEGAARIISKRSNHSVAFKCILASLCKTDKYTHVTDVMNLWKKCAPNDLDMIEARTTVESCCDAVKNGVEPVDVFSNIEQMLGLSFDWMSGRKVYEPQWKYRPVPPGANTFVLCLQFRFGHCSLGEKCPDAHGGDELEEWKVRHSISNLSSMLACSQLDREAAYIKSILDRVNEVGNEDDFLTDYIPGVSLTCAEPSKIQIQSSTMKSHSWDFKIDSNRTLNNVCLLYEVHRPYFKIGSAFYFGETNAINLKTGNLATESSLQLLEVSLCPAALALSGSLVPDAYSYNIEITCTPDVFGTFRQTVLFDFGIGEQKLVRDISVEVVPPPDDEWTREQSTPPITQRLKYPKKKDPFFGSNLKARGTWNFGNADIVDSITGERVASSMVGFALMTSPSVKRRGVSGNDKEFHYVLTKENYRDRMRFFLTQEERARQVILSKYNISAHLIICDNYDMKGGANEGTRYSVDGNLFARMTLFRDISEDTPVGRLILRNCNSVLLAKTESVNKSERIETKPRVYLCSIIEKTKNEMYFEIGCSCVKELKLLVSEVSSFDVQFQLDRTTFMEQKKVIDQLTDLHLDMLFPDFTEDFHIPWNPFMQWNSSVESKSVRLNPKQKEAFNAVTVPTSKTPPILIIGPFGTGKTFTLFQCIKKLLDDDTSRIMICTHSNSAADLYIKEYLHPMVKSGCEMARPLRIYYALRSKLTVQKEIRSYCLYDNMDRFRCPTKEEVLKHRIIVVTLSTSFMLIDLGLPSDTFSHILLDEAAQAMESEAITPLLAAGENTKLVLAGDHMQLSPELFSEDASHFHSSLLERLHCLYPDNHPCKLMLCENYRSHSAIIKFASDSFYQKKLECGLNQPMHDRYYPLTFFSARGEDVQDADSTSYYNMAEVFEVTERVADLIQTWPEKWGDWKKDNQIGVLTPYPDQVNRIRMRLRGKGLYSVSVERVLNVQGKQFRAVFLSTVRTHKPWVRILPECVSDDVDLGFFSNPKLLNTALTRAQSLVAVVGDPVSLCALGKCRRLWEDYINTCQLNNSLHGMTFTQIKQNIVGVEMRLKWGLNPLAKEFEIPENNFETAKVKPVDDVQQSVSTTVSQSSVSTKPQLQAPRMGLDPVPETSQVNRAPQNSITTFPRFHTVPNPWQNLNGGQPSLPTNYTQFHPQGQVPVPMVPVPLLMNPGPAFNSGPRGILPQPSYGPPFQMVPRAPMGYPPMGQGYIAVPIQNRSASAFAQYRPPQTPNRPPPFTGGGPGLTYPPMLQQKPIANPVPHGHAQESNPWGQPLYRSSEFMGPPPYLGPPQNNMDQRQNFFPPLPPTTWGNSSMTPRPPQQQGPISTPFRSPRPSAPWMPPPQQPMNGVVLNQKLSPEELIFLQKLLEDQNISTDDTAAIQSIREKLTQAVSGINAPQNSNMPQQQQQQVGPGGVLGFNNSRTSVSTSSGINSQSNYGVGAQFNLAGYSNGEGQLLNGMNSLQLTSNPWAMPPSGMNGVMVNGYTRATSDASTLSNIDPESDGLQRTLQNASSTNNISSSSSAFGRSYACAVKQPLILTQPESKSPILHPDLPELQDRSEKILGGTIPSSTLQIQLKPLMEMDVDFPFPTYSPPPRTTRGNSTPPPRFRAALKKSKKKK